MTAFEILTIVFYAVVVMIGYLICRGIATVIDNQKETDIHLRKMDVGLDKWLDAIADLIENKLVAIVNDTHDTKVSARELTDAVDKMHKNLCVQIADKMVDRVYPPTYNPPCYAPNGICTNPQMDCISCPKRGNGGTWSTSTDNIKEDDKDNDGLVSSNDRIKF